MIKFSIQFLTPLLLVKYFILASGNEATSSFSPPSQVMLDQLLKEFETIRSTLARIDSRVTGTDSGPTVDVREWIETITSLTRQLPFLRTVLDRVTYPIQNIGSRRGISGREESVVQLRQAIKSWAESLQRLNETLERLRETYGAYASEIASSPSLLNEGISKQEDIQLPLLSIALSNFMESTSVLRNRIGTVLSGMVRTSSNVLIPVLMSEGTFKSEKGDVDVNGTKEKNDETVSILPLNPSRGIDLTITVNEIRSQLAKVAELMSRTTSNFILDVTRRRVSNRKKPSSQDQMERDEDSLKGLDPLGFVSREFNQIRDFASKLSQG